MPTGTPYNSFVLPYKVRVDDFAESADLQTIPALHLLSHTHSDHINGLSAKSFAATVFCSSDAKEMLLRHEVYAERALKEMEIRAENVRTFQHLKIEPRRLGDGTLYYHGARDILKPLPLNTPYRHELSNNNWITITLLDANHCPGSVMYLMEGSQGAILHTGDFRAEPWFIHSLTKNPFLQRYIYHTIPETARRISDSDNVVQTLHSIYLDTACLLGTSEVPTKDEATSGLVTLMGLYRPSTRFFINAWTWGYEDLYKGVAKAFCTKIHVDRYKHSVYSHLAHEPFLKSIITRDETATRFHACERFDRCKEVNVDGWASHISSGVHVVYVNPVTMGIAAWESYLRETSARLSRGEEVNNLLVPLCRHSPLPELQSFVSLFKPRRVVPNTLDPNLGGLDWLCIPRMFGECISSEPHLLRTEVRKYLESRSTTSWTSLLPDLDASEDVSLLNLEGDDALHDAKRWVDGGKTRHRLIRMLPYLEGPEKDFVARLLATVDAKAEQSKPGTAVIVPKTEAQGMSDIQGRATLSQTERAMAHLQTRYVPPAFLSKSQATDVSTEDEDADQARDRMANFFFGEFTASQAFGKVGSSSSQPSSDPPGPGSPHTGHAKGVNLKLPLTPSSRRHSPDVVNARASSLATPRASRSSRVGVPHTPPPRILQSGALTPVQLRSPSPTARKRKRSQASQAMSQEDIDPVSVVREAPGSPFSELRNVSTRGGVLPEEVPYNPRNLKLHEREADSVAPIDQYIAQAELTQKIQAGRTRKKAKTLAQVAADCPSTLLSVVSDDIPMTSSFDTDHLDRRKTKSVRRKIAQQLSQARQDVVTEKYPDQGTQISVPGRHEEVVPSSSPTLKPLIFPDDLPTSDTPTSADVPMSLSRSLRLAKTFRAEFAKGRRPGAVVPRLSCLESQ